MVELGYRTYVAIGDSNSEGLGDFTFAQNRSHNGWTDRLAGLISSELAERGHQLSYANLGLRGSKTNKIMTLQLEQALALKPDLVTIQAGSNDFKVKNPELLAPILTQGIRKLQAAGATVLVATTIRPSHLRFFKGLLPRAERMSTMIRGVAAQTGVQVVDIHSLTEFSQLAFWCEDMVHFSGHGHIRVANLAADMLGLKYRVAATPAGQMDAPKRDLYHTLRWYVIHVAPFVKRRIKGVSSGDGLVSKHQGLTHRFAFSHQPLLPANRIVLTQNLGFELAQANYSQAA